MISALPTTRLIGTPVTATKLGFGCSNLLGNKSRAEGLRLLETAYDAGIRHFDVAPYYGFGEAEELLGELARSKRDSLTITTKFGLEPNGRLSQSRGAVTMARAIMKKSGVVRRLIQKSVALTTQRGRFDVESARRSLDRSLLLLKIPAIDIFLLHEPKASSCDPDLLKFLTEMQRSGKIRSFGIGGQFEDVEAISEVAPLFATVTQFRATAMTPRENRFIAANAGTRAILNHGCLAALKIVQQRVNASHRHKQLWKKLVGFDPADDIQLSAILLRLAAETNPNGVLLFSSEQPERIKANARAILDPKYDPAQLAGVMEVLSK